MLPDFYFFELKAYFVQFTDELTPQMEWLNDKSEQINKPLKSDSAEETEVLVERVENVISQLEKKKKVTIFKYNLYISH